MVGHFTRNERVFVGCVEYWRLVYVRPAFGLWGKRHMFYCINRRLNWNWPREKWMNEWEDKPDYFVNCKSTLITRFKHQTVCKMVMVSSVCVLFLVFIVGQEHKRSTITFPITSVRCVVAVHCFTSTALMHLVFLFQTFSEIHWTEGMGAGCEFTFQLIWVNV